MNNSEERQIFDLLKRSKIDFDKKIRTIDILIKKLDKQLKEIQI